MKVGEKTWVNIGKFATLVSLAVGSYHIAALISKYKSVKSESESNNSNDSVSVPTTSILVNRSGEAVQLKLADGNFMKGYILPDDVSKVKFPLQVITKPNTNLFGLGEAASFPVQKAPNGELFYNGMIGSVEGNYLVNYNDLKNQALAL